MNLLSRLRAKQYNRIIITQTTVWSASFQTRPAWWRKWRNIKTLTCPSYSGLILDLAKVEDAMLRSRGIKKASRQELRAKAREFAKVIGR